ncbi:hypothetical protein TNCV_955051 [Trichonephila clavipes]|nr:hypothetical protein TNCV_955051 [Trichonephila clavipes]
MYVPLIYPSNKNCQHTSRTLYDTTKAVMRSFNLDQSLSSPEIVNRNHFTGLAQYGGGPVCINPITAKITPPKYGDLYPMDEDDLVKFMTICDN